MPEGEPTPPEQQPCGLGPLLAAAPRTRSAWSVLAALVFAAFAITATVAVTPGLAPSAFGKTAACPVPDPKLFTVNDLGGAGGSDPVCSYGVKELRSQGSGPAQPVTVGGFAVTVRYACAADTEASWTGKPRDGAQVSDSQILFTNKKSSGTYSVTNGNFTTQEKAFLRLSPTALATVVAYSDNLIFVSKGLAGIAAAVATDNPAPSPLPCAGKPGGPANEPSTSAVRKGKLDVLVSFASRGTMDQLLDRVMVRIFVRDETTDKAVAGAHVEMTYKGAVVATAETGADGTLELPVIVQKPKGRVMVEVQVTATKAGYPAAQSGAGGPFDFNTKSTSISFAPIEGRKTIADSVTITGRVTAADFGFLTQGVQSKIAIGAQETTTDADGNFSIVTRAEVGGVDVSAYPAQADRFSTSSVHVDMDVEDPGDLVMTAEPDRGVYGLGDVITITGSVLTDKGQRVDATITAQMFLTNPIAPIGVGADGSFSFQLPAISNVGGAEAAGRVTVRVDASAPGYRKAQAVFSVRVATRIGDCRPAEARIAAGFALVHSEKDDGPGFAPPTWGPGHPFADASTVIPRGGRVVLAFTLDEASGATAAITVGPDAGVTVAQYCVDGQGRTRLVLEAKDRSQVRVHVDAPSGTRNWRVDIVTPAVTATNIKTDYQVAVKGDTTGIGVLEGAVSVEPTTGKKAVTVEAGQFATVRTGHPEVVIEQLGPDAKPALEDPAPLVAGAASGSSGAAGEPATVHGLTVQAGRRKVRPGETVDLPIWIVGATDLANINVTATFDPAIVAVDSAKPDPVRQGSFVDHALFQANPKQAGEVKIGLAGTKGSNGTGTLAVIRFAAVGRPGDHSSVHLEVTTINDSSGTPLTIDRHDGRIDIISPADALPGDCDGNARLDEGDSLCALQMSVQLRPPAAALDVDGKNGVTSRDAAIILQRTVGRA